MPVCTACTHIVAHVKDPTSTFDKKMWYGNMQIMHNTSGIIKIRVVATANGRRRVSELVTETSETRTTASVFKQDQNT